jgi:hypothetical protein
MLITHVERYLSLRQTLGYKLHNHQIFFNNFAHDVQRTGSSNHNLKTWHESWHESSMNVL